VKRNAPAGATRRAFLAGAGALVALPFLPSLVSGRASGSTARPLRFVAWYVPNGIHMQDFTPATTGQGYALTPILQPLAGVRDDLLVVSGLANRGAQDNVAGDHARGTGAFLTCARPDPLRVAVGVSLDQVIASQQPTTMSLSSLQLATEGSNGAGVCDGGLPCGYQGTISYADATTPLPTINAPALAFDRLFAPLESGITQAERDRRRALHTSILDGLSDPIARLQRTVSSEDSVRVDEYLSGIRALELRVANSAVPPNCTVPTRPSEPIDLPARIELFSELMVGALSCDLTRVITFMSGNGGSDQSFPFLNAPESHHVLSHHSGDPEKIAKVVAINTWEMAIYASFLEKLRAVPEGDGTLLDHTVVLFSSEVSDGNLHTHTDLPVLVGGGRLSGLQTGQHLRTDGEQPIADLYLALLSAMGLPQATFGLDGTRPLAGVL